MSLRSSSLAVPLAAVAAALAIVAYANSLHGPFTFDDQHEVVTNTSIMDLGRPFVVLFGHSFTRPVVNVSYAIDYARGGADEFAFHVTNVTCHVLNVLLLFAITRRLVGDAGPTPRIHAAVPADTIAFVSAGLFAVHPMMTEAVSFVSSRSELLVTTFFLSGMYCFRRGFTGRRWWLAGGAICFLLAIGSKETAVVLPLVLLASDMLVSAESDWRTRLWRVHVPLLSVICLGAAARVWLYLAVEHRGADDALTLQNAILQLHVLVRYVSLLVLPVHQTVVPPVAPIVSFDDVRLIEAGVGLAGIGAVGFIARRRAPLVTFGLVWLLLALLPSSGLTLMTEFGQAMAEHRVYLASCGFFISVGTLLVWLTNASLAPEDARFGWTVTGVGLVLMVLLLLTVARNRVWADPVRLWEEAVRRSPDAMIAHLWLGDTYRVAGNCDAAKPSYNRAIALRPNRPFAYLGLAGCFADQRQFYEAAETLRTGINNVPRDVQLRLALAEIEESAFLSPSEALRLCLEAVTIQPDSVDAQNCVRRLKEGVPTGGR
jgi:protein O-mannosyl-transferase